MPNHTGHLPYFNNNYLPSPTNAYVAWLDAMGIQGVMSRSLNISANFVFKIHITARECAGNQIRLYPVMDGVYCVSENQAEMIQFLRDFFSRMADLFVSTQDMLHRFAVRGALAYGPIVHGDSLSREASNTLANNPQHRDSILLGMPVIQAYLGERKSPPFGMFVGESARAFTPAGSRPINVTWWAWFRGQNQLTALAVELKRELTLYYKWCEERSLSLEYDVERIKVHRAMVGQYLIDLPQEACAD